MIIPVLFIILGIWHALIRIRPIMHTWLVKVIKCRVGNIQKKGQGKVWITICFGIIVIVIHITKISKKIKKQINKKKESKI